MSNALIPNIAFCVTLILVSVFFQYCFVKFEKFSLSYARYIIYGAILASLESVYIEPNSFYSAFFVLYLMGMSLVYIKYKQIDLNTAEKYGKYVSFLLGVINILILILTSCSSVKIITIVAMFIYTLPIAIWWAYYGAAKAAVTADTVVAIVQTNTTEVKEYLQTSFKPRSILMLVGMACIGYLFKSHFPIMKFNAADNWMYGKLIALLVINIWLIKKNSDNFFIEPIQETREYIEGARKFKLQIKKREKRLKEELEKYGQNSKGVYVLVIGESQNREHMSAYGYDKKTTPWLDEQKENPNFVILNKAFSSYAQTVRALAYALTAKNQYNTIPLEDAPSIVEVANALGYKTIWISNQMKFGINATTTSIIAEECTEDYWLNATNSKMRFTRAYDGEILKYLDNIEVEDKTLIVLHLTGNHELYELRYPKEFNAFGEATRVACYDNSMLYNDYVVERFLEKAKTIPNFKSLIYMADHSEDPDLGLAHDTNKFTMAMVKIPMWIYFSDDYLAGHDELVQNLKNSSDKYFTNDMLFDCMLSIMGAKLEELSEPSNDISSKEYNGCPSRFRTMYGKVKLVE